MSDKPGTIAKRFGVNLTERDVAYLYEIAVAKDVTPTEVFRRSIRTEYKLLKAVQAGGQVLVEKADGTWLELDLHY